MITRSHVLLVLGGGGEGYIYLGTIACAGECHLVLVI